MSGWMRFAAAALAGMLMFACGGGGDEGEEAPETTDTETTEPAEEPAGGSEVAIVNFVYEPDPIEVAVGTEVTWTNGDAAPHTATADDGSFDTGTLDQGASGSATFEEAGEFAYHCTVHPDMTGTVVVS